MSDGSAGQAALRPGLQGVEVGRRGGPCSLPGGRGGRLPWPVGGRWVGKETREILRTETSRIACVAVWGGQVGDSQSGWPWPQGGRG